MLSAKKVQSYRAAREEEVGLVVDKIVRAAAKHTAVDMSELLSKFTIDVMCRAVAGRSFRVEGRDRVFRELIDQGMALMAGFNLENLYPGLAKAAGGVLVRPARRKAERIRERWDELIDRLIDEHANEVAADGVPAVCHGAGDTSGGDLQEFDFIHVLLSVQEEYGLTRDSIKGILVNMFAAGTETVYLVLEFAMAELMLDQDIMAKLQHELRSSTLGQEAINENKLTRMAYLKAVVKETLRLHPPTPLLLPHLSLGDCDVDGFRIPAGTTAVVNVWAIGRDPRVWENADEFVPERFISNGEIGGVDLGGNDFRFLPSGSGRRICPGINFAVATIEIMLANLVCHFDWELPHGVDKIDMTEVFGLTVSRREKLLLVPKIGDIDGRS
ncbi:hypothetical protein BS78_06G060900 [Paspalum vaginatum]|nr:hypothetical protein BS78_06G060900 [Paspalum vaginatum]